MEDTYAIKEYIKKHNHITPTFDEAIYAIGDAVSVKHYVTGEEVLISFVCSADKQGCIAAYNIYEGNSHYK